MFVCEPCASQKSEEGVVVFGTEITDSWELPWRNRELNAGPPQMSQALPSYFSKLSLPLRILKRLWRTTISQLYFIH